MKTLNQFLKESRIIPSLEDKRLFAKAFFDYQREKRKYKQGNKEIIQKSSLIVSNLLKKYYQKEISKSFWDLLD
jgi:hypothetical protein